MSYDTMRDTEREWAVESLLDLDPRSPSYRLNKILMEGPKAIEKWRPNHISDAALLDIVDSLADYEIASPSHKEFCPDISMPSDMKQKNMDSINNAGGKETSLIDENTIRSRIMRYHHKNLTSKINRARGESQNNCPISPDPMIIKIDESHGDTVETFSEKPKVSVSMLRLIAMLRTVYEAQNADCGLTVSADSSSSLQFSSIVDYLQSHPVFTSKLTTRIGAPSEESDPTLNASEMVGDGYIYSMNDAVLTEAVIGDACFLHSLQSEGGCDNLSALEVVNGYLIAAMMVFSSCYTQTEICTDDTVLQVGGVMSLISEKYIHYEKQDIVIDHCQLLKLKNAINKLEEQSEQILKENNPDEHISNPPMKPTQADSSVSDQIMMDNDHLRDNGDMSMASSNHHIEASPTDEVAPHDNSDGDSGSDYENYGEDHHAINVTSRGHTRIILSARSAFDEDEEMDEEDEDHEDEEQDEDEEFDEEDYGEDHDDDMYEEEIEEVDEFSSPEGADDVLSDQPSSVLGTNDMAEGTLLLEPQSGTISFGALYDTVKSVDSEYVACDDSNAMNDISVHLCPEKEQSLELIGSSSEYGMGTTVNDAIHPSTISDLEMIPASNVFCHLVKVASSIIDEKLLGDISTLRKAPSVLCMGAVSSSLCPSVTGTAVDDRKKSFWNNFMKTSSDVLSFHLLVALIHFIQERRNKIMLEIEQMIDDIVTSFEPDETTADMPIVDETDDPASVLGEIPTYVAYAPSLSTSKEYEEKGLLRKAAAAARSATIVRENIRQKIYSLCRQLQTLSDSLNANLQCLRKLMLLGSSNYLLCKDFERCKDSFISFNMPTECSLILPMARMRLSSSISQLVSSDSLLRSGSFKTKLSTFSSEYMVLSEINRSSLNLFQEAVQLWGESLYLLYPSKKELKDLFDRLIRVTMMYDFVPEASSLKLDSLPEKVERLGQLETLEKLQVMCWRLRRADLLALVVPRPCRYSEHMEMTQTVEDHVICDQTLSYLGSLRKMSSFVGSFSRLSNVLKLYRAICYRVIRHWILWDGCTTEEDSNFKVDLQSQDVDLSQSIRIVDCSSIEFDSLKCPDSISVRSPVDGKGNSAIQTGNKIWGTVIGVKGYNARSGIHRWAVRLDQCEKGHIFIGVATRETSMKTYVGGDKYGWGVIGTRALWHDRRKIKTDYGKLFRSGTIIIVTLDTDAGTIRFGSWERMSDGDSNYSGSYIDWGLAFDGLPLDSTFFPAVGLYQREDRVTLMAVCFTSPSHDSCIQEKNKRRSLERIFYPHESAGSEDDVNSRNRMMVCRWNATMCNHSITFLVDMLSLISNHLASGENEGIQRIGMFNQELLAVVASLSLIPVYIPFISGSIAFEILPLIIQCCKLLSEQEHMVTPFPISTLQKGKWVIRSTRTPSGDGSTLGETYDEFDVDLRLCAESTTSGIMTFEGDGLCTDDERASKKVTIAGIAHGTLIHIIQVVENGISFADARLNLDGTMFQGTLNDSRGKIVGAISAILVPDDNTSSFEQETGFNVIHMPLAHLCNLLSNASRHMCLILTNCVDLNDIHPLATSSLLSNGRLMSNSSSLLEEMYRFTLVSDRRSSRELCKESVSFHQRFAKLIGGNWPSPSLILTPPMLYDNVKAIDSALVKIAGGTGSLRSLSPTEYDLTRLNVITSILHLRMLNPQTMFMNNAEDEDLRTVWLMAVRIMENNIRKALSASAQRVNYKVVICSQCTIIRSISNFLLQIAPPNNIDTRDVEAFYSACGPDDLTHLMDSIRKVEIHYIFKGFSLKAVDDLLQIGHTSIYAENALITLTKILGPGRYLCRTEGSSFEYDIFRGAHYSVQLAIRSLLSSIIRHISSIMSSLEINGYNPTDSYSLTVTFLSVFLINMQSADVLSIIGEGHKFWAWFGSLIRFCKMNLDWNSLNNKAMHIRDALDAASKRLVAADLMRCSIFTLNSVLMHMNAVGSLDSFISPISILKSEMTDILEEISIQESSRHHDKITAEIMRDFEQLADLSHSNEPKVTRRGEGIDEETVSLRALSPLIELSLLNVCMQRLTLMSPGSELSVSPIHLMEGYVHLLIDTCSCFMFSSASATITLFDISWISVLVSQILHSGSVNKNIPFSISIRILRLFRLILPKLDAASVIVMHLLKYIGLNQISSLALESSMNNAAENEVYHLLVESISLLRGLYGLPNNSWRLCINRLIEGCREAECNIMLGALAFFGGLPSRLTIGSWILLRPKTELTFKSVTSRRFGSSTLTSTSPLSPKCITSGFDGVINSLYRHDIPAGIVTCVEPTVGSCNVLLMDRCNSFPIGERPPSPEFLRVCTVSVPESDIFLVDEYPLRLGSDSPIEILTDFPRQLLSEETSLMTETNFDCAKLLLILRCYASILTQKSMPERLNRLIPSKLPSPFYIILQLANDQFIMKHFPRLEPITRESLSSLPAYEARYWMIKGMLSELIRRKRLVNSSHLFDHLESVPSPNNYYVNSSSVLATECRIEETDNSINQMIDGPSSRTTSRSSSLQQQSRGDDHESSGEEEEVEDSAQVEDETDLEHLREVVILQMAELGLPRSWSDYSLRHVGGINIEAAVHFCLEHAADMERLISEEQDRDNIAATGTLLRRDMSGSGGRTAGGSDLVRQLLDMGFPVRWCEEALANASNNLDEALTWILNNGERLSSLDDENEDIDEDEDDVSMGLESDRRTEANQESVDSNPEGRYQRTPLYEISGSCSINQQTLEVSGLPNSGFSSVGTKGILLTKGKWYYEVLLVTAGCIQVGWADSTFSGHCNADRGDGCGDGPSSWAYDGWRKYLWHKHATAWGCQWQEGDIIGCLLDMDSKTMSFTLNGRGEEIGMGIAFHGDGFRYAGGVYACVSFNRKERLRLFLGDSFGKCHYTPPAGYCYVGEAIVARYLEWKERWSEENFIKSFPHITLCDDERFLCDQSDEEHGHELFLWQHRFCTDACVHIHSKFKDVDDQSRRSKSMEFKEKKRTVSDNGLTTLISVASSKIKSDLSFKRIDGPLQRLQESYEVLMQNLLSDYVDASLALSHLYARKNVLLLAALMSNYFDMEIFRPLQNVNTLFENDEKVSQLFWCVIEKCCSLYHHGWTGETSVMVMAAEHLNIGVIGLDYRDGGAIPNTKLSFMCIDRKTDRIPSAMMSLVLNTVRSKTRPSGKNEGFETDLFDVSLSYPACVEMALLGSSTNIFFFIRSALQNAVMHSQSLMNIVLGVVRRSVRLLSTSDNLNHSTDSAKAQSSDEITGITTSRDVHDCFSVDARLLSSLTGLLLSDCVWEGLQLQGMNPKNSIIYTSLFESWSIGLLSPSIAFRTMSAWTVAAILHRFPEAYSIVTLRSPTLQTYFEDLASKVARRIWTERSAAPIFSHYLQALLELISTVRRAVTLSSNLASIFEPKISVDAATPIPLNLTCDSKHSDIAEVCTQTLPFWEWNEGWVESDGGWDVWLGTVEYFAVDWTPPAPSAVRSLVDSGDGPPLLREGCTVVRSLDWAEDGSGALGDEDGKNSYEQEKEERVKERKAIQVGESGICAEDTINDEEIKSRNQPLLPIGKVLSIESWNGEAGLARRVQWNRTGIVGLYRFGADGGRFDICHIETNKKETRVTKRYPFPETAEQIAVRNGFGYPKKYNVLLRLRKNCMAKKTNDGSEIDRLGILEWPDFGAAVLVDCQCHHDGAVTMTEKRLIYGSNDSGWEARFGKPTYEPGTVIVLSRLLDSKLNFNGYDELLGSTSYVVDKLRNKKNGERLRVSFEMRMVRGNSASTLHDAPSLLPPLRFDSTYHAQSIGISLDGMTATCLSTDGRGTAFASVGFCKGIHYWEVKIEQAEAGSIFIGVSEKNYGKSGPSTGSVAIDGEIPRLNKWLGWGFANFRATYNAGVERIYGAHCHTGDTVGVLLDCDSGRLSFFVDSVKYGEHILNDLGCAFENLSPFGFIDGYGSGGAGRGAFKASDGSRTGRPAAFGAVRPKALWPVIGFKNVGDRVTFSGKWMTSFGVDGVTMLKNSYALDDTLWYYSRQLEDAYSSLPRMVRSGKKYEVIPQGLVHDAFQEYQMWLDDRLYRTETRGSGPLKLSFNNLFIDVDRTPLACAIACANMGLSYVLLPDDKVRVKRSAGRVLELPEDAIVLGAYQGRLWYRLISQRGDGGSLSEGGNRAWFWNESEVVSDSLSPLGTLRAGDIKLPTPQRFQCMATGGIRIIYSGGAVMRTDIEIFDGSATLGVIPFGTTIPKIDVSECRFNSSGVLRYRVKYSPIGEGWISERIRGGKEELILESIHTPSDCTTTADDVNISPEACAHIWFQSYKDFSENADFKTSQFNVSNIREFEDLLYEGLLSNMSPCESDSHLSAVLSAIAEKSDCQVFNISLKKVASVVEEACTVEGEIRDVKLSPSSSESLPSRLLFNMFEKAGWNIPSSHAIIARMSLIRVLNRRAVYALPLVSLPCPQENSSLLGGNKGLGASINISESAVNEPDEHWFRSSSSLGMRIRKFRTLLFPDVKNLLLNSLMEVTTSHTPLPHDEYEFPRDIRTVRINRVKAHATLTSSDVNMRKKHSIFYQLYTEMKSWNGTALRRSFIAKGHGGQKRAFKVKLLGEGVNDYSGPYREVFTDAIKEVFVSDENGFGYLGLTVRSSNAISDVGENRHLFLFAGDETEHYDRMQLIRSCISPEERLLSDHFFSGLDLQNEFQRERGDYIFFLGVLCGMALRHNIQLDLPLPLGTFWKRLCAESSDEGECLKEIDYLCWRRLYDHKNMDDESLPPLPAVLQQRMLNMFVQGLSLVVPSEVFLLFTGEELRTLFCGKGDIDVNLLKSITEYEGFDENCSTVQDFWDILEHMSEDDRKSFLQFVWSRRRLPSKKSDFETSFKIQRDVSENSLPSASTCFFTLTLPSYKDKETLKKKLLFAIHNVTTMESDYVTNDGEVAEGWRGV